MSATDLMYFNGIDGDSGAYDLPAMTGRELVGLIRGEATPENLTELKARYRSATVAHMGVKEGVDATRLEQAGWGIIFPKGVDPAVKEALHDLIELRRGQAGEYFRIFEGEQGYRPGEGKSAFLARNGGTVTGPVDPQKMPYYLLLAGGPRQIPYQFQTQLDVQYGVGRIAFDSLQDYANYARSVVEAESGRVRLARQALFFGVANAGDQATQLSAGQLVQPLYAKFKAERPDWQVTAALGDSATKARLARSLGGEGAPALLFAAGHGMSFRNGAERQLQHQGALLCQDWPGPSWQQAVPQDFYFAADDLADDARLLGMIAVFFACFGAGTPQIDQFNRQLKPPKPIAPHDFLAKLPQKMLAHPRGGALAVLGHVDRAWGYSFLWPGAGRQTGVFESAIQRLLDGQPVGLAVEYFNERYAELSTVLSDRLEDLDFGKKIDPNELAGDWTANNDARGYVVIGDPAARLPMAPGGEDAVERPVITAATVQPPRAEPVRSDFDAQAAAESAEADSAKAELAQALQRFAEQVGAAPGEIAATIEITPQDGEVRRYSMRVKPDGG